MNDRYQRWFGLAVGGVQIRVTCEQDFVIQQLRNGYSLDWHAAPARGEFELAIEMAPGLPTATDADRDLTITAGLYTFESEAYSGTLDFQIGRGHLKLCPERVFEGIDYCLRVIAAVLILDQGGLLAHAAGCVDGHGGGMLFIGPSGAGKSTVGRYLNETAGFSCFNDDLTALLPGKKKLDPDFHAVHQPSSESPSL